MTTQTLSKPPSRQTIQPIITPTKLTLVEAIDKDSIRQIVIYSRLLPKSLLDFPLTPPYSGIDSTPEFDFEENVNISFDRGFFFRQTHFHKLLVEKQCDEPERYKFTFFSVENWRNFEINQICQGFSELMEFSQRYWCNVCEGVISLADPRVSDDLAQPLIWNNAII